MSALGAFRRQQLITAMSAVTSLEIDLCVTADKDGPTGVPTDVSYAAQAITLSDAGDGTNLNHTAVTFPAVSTSYTAGWYVIRTATSGNMEVYGQFNSPQNISAGQTFTIEANTLGITTDPA